MREIVPDVYSVCREAETSVAGKLVSVSRQTVWALGMAFPLPSYYYSLVPLLAPAGAAPPLWTTAASSSGVPANTTSGM